MRRRLIRLLLLLPALLVFLVGCTWLWLWHTESGANWAWNLARDQLAAMQRAPRLDGTIHGTLGRGIRIESVAFDDEAVSITVQEIQARPRLNLSPPGVEITELKLLGVELVSHESDSEPDEPFSMEDIPNLSLPYPVTVNGFDIAQGAFVRGDTRIEVSTITGRLNWHRKLDLEVSFLETPELAGSLTLDSELVPPFRLTSGVRIQRFTIPDSLENQFYWLPGKVDLQANVKGTPENLEIAGTLNWPDWLSGGVFQGRFKPLDSLGWELGLDVVHANLPGKWIGQALDEERQAEIGTITLNKFSVIGNGTDQSYQFEGDTGIATQWIDSPDIRFAVSGDNTRLERWSASGQARVSASGWPVSEIDFSANGAGDSLDLSLSAPEIFGGALDLEVETLETDDSGPDTPNQWRARLSADNLATTPLLEAISPHLDKALFDQLQSTVDVLDAETLGAEVRASGQIDPLSISMDIQSFTTGVRNHKVTASGLVEYSQGTFSTGGLNVISGSSSLELRGAWDETPSLELNLAVKDLAHFVPGSAGSFQGWISFRDDTIENPGDALIRAELSGEGLRLLDWQVSQARISELSPTEHVDAYPVFADVPSRPPIAVEITVSELNGPMGEFPYVNLLAAGNLGELALAFETQTRDISLSAALTAGSETAPRGAWTGVLQALDLTVPPGSEWRLLEPAEIAYREGFVAESVCLESANSALVCLGVEHDRQAGQSGWIRLTSVAPDAFGPMAQWPLAFSQAVSGEITWQRSQSEVLSAAADLVLSAGIVTSEPENFELVRTGDGALRFDLRDGSLTSGTVQIPLSSGTVDIEFSLGDIMQGIDSPLEGKVRVDLANLETLAVLVPSLSRVSGALSLDLDLAGTGQNPRLTGTTSLRDGQFFLPAPGLRLRDVNITGQLDTENVLRLEGGFTAGEGAGRIEGRIDARDLFNPTIDARLTGERMSLINTPEIQLVADSDIRFGWDGDETINILGTVHVPQARFAPQYLPSDTASESADVVIISNGEVLEKPASKSRSIRINGDLAVSIGENVVVDLELARARGTGAVMFSWRGDPAPIANGEYNLRGDIQAYGQTLEITRASIRFPNVPASNPYLDVRAERRIYGNSLISKAGVIVNGTLRRPHTEPYTVPATNADRARALLITGSDFDFEQGVGAVNVGTYIAPKLYLSYGVGLFEEGNIFTARYELRQNFGVRATSGQDETGIDFTYTIER